VSCLRPTVWPLTAKMAALPGKKTRVVSKKKNLDEVFHKLFEFKFGSIIKKNSYKKVPNLDSEWNLSGMEG